MGCIPAPACKKALVDATFQWPSRTRASDGICGDEAHQARKSNHNTGDAFDLTHDPLNGVDCHSLSLQVIEDPRVTYVIWNGRIFKTRIGHWEVYQGANAHRHHMHVSIKSEARNDLSPWPWSPDTDKMLRRGDRGTDVREVQEKLGIEADGVFGFGTEKAVKKFQRENGLRVNGVVDKETRAILFAEKENS